MKKTIAEIDECIKLGQAHRAEALLLSLNLKNLNSYERVEFAQQARRLNLPETILKILGPVVRPVFKSSVGPSTAEKALYAVGLTRIGAFQEAQKLLCGLDAAEFPDIDLFKAHLCIYNWDYAQAIPLLKKYLMTLSDPYQSLVCNLNIAAAHLHCLSFSKFEKEISETLEKVNPEKHFLIHGNAHELLAQYHILKRDFKLSRETLDIAQKYLVNATPQYAFFVKKWRVLSGVLDESLPLSDLNILRDEAQSIQQWETCREIDFYESWATNNQELQQKVYWGTPYEGYRRKMKMILNSKLKLNSEFNWSVPLVNDQGHSIESKSSVLNLFQGQIQGSHVSLADQPKLFQLLRVLAKDFYKPIQIGEIFNSIYQNEFYSVESSPDRVGRLIKRLRIWMSEQNFPLALEIENSSVLLKATARCQIYFNTKNSPPRRQERQLEILKNELKDSPFEFQEIAKVLKISDRASRRFLEWGKANNKIFGGKGTGFKRFRFVA